MSSESCSSSFIFSSFSLSFFLLRPPSRFSSTSGQVGWSPLLIGHLTTSTTVLITWICWYNDLFETLVGLLSRHYSVLISNINCESVGLKSILQSEDLVF